MVVADTIVVSSDTILGQLRHNFFQIILDARNEGLLCLHAAESGRWKADGIESNLSCGRDFWSAELFVPFNPFKRINGAQIPQTSSAGPVTPGCRCASGSGRRQTVGEMPARDRMRAYSTALFFASSAREEHRRQPIRRQPRANHHMPLTIFSVSSTSTWPPSGPTVLL
jgi:hypothetical protein